MRPSPSYRSEFGADANAPLVRGGDTRQFAFEFVRCREPLTVDPKRPKGPPAYAAQRKVVREPAT